LLMYSMCDDMTTSDGRRMAEDLQCRRVIVQIC
jgi:hypothetical protein